MKATKILKKKDAGYASRWKQKRGGKGEQQQLLPVLLRMCVCVSVCLCVCVLYTAECASYGRTRGLMTSLLRSCDDMWRRFTFMIMLSVSSSSFMYFCMFCM